MKTNTVQQFSWNRVRIALMFFEKSDAFFMKDGTLVISFLFHQHEVWLWTNGRGMLYNPWDEKSQKYSLVMPRDIQEMVNVLYEEQFNPIPIKMDLN